MTHRTLAAVTRFGLALAVALVVAGAVPASAQTLGDADGDGVADALDMCPTTPRGDLVSAEGCSVCPCDAAWSSHTAYVSCVSYEVNRRYTLGLVTRKQRSAIISAAKNSTCGTTNTRCCTWRKLVTGSLGTCTVMDPAKCSFTVLGKWAENRGPGSCYYNPCTW